MKKLIVVGVLLSGLVFWTPAQAITPTSANIDCSAQGAQGPFNFSGAVGESFTLVNTGASQCTVAQTAGVVTPSGAGYNQFGALGPEISIGGTATFTIVAAGAFTVTTVLGTGTAHTVSVTAGGGGGGLTTTTKGTFDTNGGSCIFAGVPKTGVHEFFTVGTWYAPGRAECSRPGYAFADWMEKSSPSKSSGLSLLNDNGVKRYFVAQAGDYVARWERWVADGVQGGVGPLGGLGSSVAMSDDGNVIAGGGNFGPPRVFRRADSTSSWSSPLFIPNFYVLFSAVALSGDGSNFVTTSLMALSWLGQFVGDSSLRATVPSSSTTLQIDTSSANVLPTVGSASGRTAALSRDGSVYATGERLAGPNGSGTVRVFSSSAATAFAPSIFGEERGDGFGSSVAVSSDGSTLVVGAPLNDGSGRDAGSVRVYRRSTMGTWSQIGSDIDGESVDDRFGFSVAVSANGNTIVVGAPFNDGAGANAGQVRVFDWKDNRWTQRGDDIDGAAAGNQAGHSVAVSGDGNVLAFGSPFASMIDWDKFRENVGRCPYTTDPVAKLFRDLFFGCDGREGGRADVMRWTSESWNPVGLPIPGDSRRRVGFSVDMSADGTKLVVGAPGLSATLDSLFYGGELREYRLE